MPEPTPRKLIAGILIATVLILALVIADLAIGGRPDPPALRAAAITLDDAWRFHTGDDPSWARADTDDSNWQALDMTAAPGSHDGDVGLPDYVAGWMARGHEGYHGYAWYRREVTVPPSPASWDLLGPTLVENSYELYWNGALLGGSGRLGDKPRAVGTRPMRFALPADAAGSRGLLAVRVYMLPGDWGSEDSGGMHTPPILAPRPVGEALHRVQWQRTIAGYIADAVEPLAMFALIGLAWWCRARSSHPAFLAFASVALAFMAARRLNNAIVAWTDLQDLTTYSWLASWMWVPAVAAWTLAWNRWCARPWRSIDLAAAALAAAAIAGIASDAAIVTSAARYGSIALLVIIGVRIVRGGPPRLLSLLTLATIMAGLFGGELLDWLGIPGIWFPFGIGVSRTQYVYALLIPLLGVLFVRTLLSRDTARS
jgi:hypothetical protein